MSAERKVRYYEGDKYGAIAAVLVEQDGGQYARLTLWTRGGCKGDFQTTAMEADAIAERLVKPVKSG